MFKTEAEEESRSGNLDSIYDHMCDGDGIGCGSDEGLSLVYRGLKQTLYAHRKDEQLKV